ncbi:uncharacterized protein PV06_11726 [Exophiala oligosperma]|uniref:Major facilitator superfamily (MFS) profile domain-containing protein n=1 Tax=Exophiala oligosperma TaxID=215243 RepID=A0A0D2DJT6_9EURO|nr:uncharacterized protein PV06_11726 [Exophiala oligosperma]KIW35964.1 hypothetical protein PV06_11726 [Exophiala oligosperma]
MLAITAIIDTKFRIRGPLIIFLAAMTLAGLARNQMVILTFGQNNTVGTNARMAISVANLAYSVTGGIIGSTIFRSQDAPTYGPTLYTTMGVQAALIVVRVSIW